MSTLTWNAQLALGHSHLDGTHQEFVGLVAQLQQAAHEPVNPTAMGAALKALVEHTEAHFAMEERWLLALGFQNTHCHFSEHASVMQVMREVYRRHLIVPDAELANNLVQALAEWFPPHARSLDAGLTELMHECGVDPHTLAVARPPVHTHQQEGAAASCGPDACGPDANGPVASRPFPETAGTPAAASA